MKESISSTWVMQIVIGFILIFAAYLTVSINYGKAFRLKNDALSIIEKKNGFSTDAIQTLNLYLANNSYSAKGQCPDGYYAYVGSLSDTSGSSSSFVYIENGENNNASYCFQKITGYNKDYPSRSYYKFILFINFDLPIIGDITDFKSEGQTTEIDHTDDSSLVKIVS